MKIQILGSGCTNCKKLYELTKTAVKELAIDANVEYITDVSKIIEMGVMQTPVLAVDGKPILTGFVPNIEKIKNVLLASKSHKKISSTEKKCNCKPGCC